MKASASSTSSFIGERTPLSPSDWPKFFKSGAYMFISHFYDKHSEKYPEYPPCPFSPWKKNKMALGFFPYFYDK